MLVRNVAMIASLALLVVGITLQFLYPVLATYIFWLFLAWIVLSFFIFRLPVMSRSIGRSANPSPPGTLPSASGGSTGAPLTTSAPSYPTAAPPIGFCIYCAAAIEPGTTVCPACGHALSPI
ncbi:MAG: hypothetical protein WB778_02560 [Thermoplasmata archaeon]